MSAAERTNRVPPATHQLSLPNQTPVSMNPQTIKVACSNCNLRELCMPVGLNEQQLQRIDEVVAVRRKIKRGSTLFRNGESFT